MKMFVETGQTNDLELEHESSNGAFDFTASAILSGSGYTEATIFADANHTLVSFLTKITPSPDWFVGLDSLKVTIKRPKTYLHLEISFFLLSKALPKRFLDRQHNS